MEKKKQLNFSAPLLSVRRHSSSLPTTDRVHRTIIEKSPPDRRHSLPLQRSDWELEQVAKPAAVPFLWERTPGRPKGECMTHSSEEPSFTPRLPPGRLPYVSHKSGEVSREQTIDKRLAEALAFNDHSSLLESLKESLHAEGESNNESGEDTFSDALDTLSPTESLSLNCSVSGLSGSYGRNRKSSGSFSIDPQTRDFMMSRFLPAAKAAVLETPQYVPRNQNVVTEHPKLVNKIISAERKPLLKQQGSSVISFFNQYTEDVESEDGEDDHDDPGKRIGKTCGFLPRLRVKNSRSLLNPEPGTKLRTQALTPSVGQVKRLMRNAYSGPLDKRAYDAIYKKRYHSGVLSQELHKVENKLTNEPRRISYSSDSYKMEGLSPCRRPRSGGISPYRNERPPSPFREGSRFLGLPKEVELKDNKVSSFIKREDNFQDVPSQRSYRQESESFRDADEKTLYIDSVNNMGTLDTTLDSSKAEKPLNSSSRKLTMMAENRGVGKHLSSKRYGQDIERPYVLVGGGNVKPKSGSLHSVLPTSTCITKPRRLTDKMESLNLNLNFDREKESLGFTQPHPDENLDMRNEHNLKPDEQRDSNAAVLLSPLPPPLPKSPSESWLWRTLPSISLRNPFSHSQGSHFHSKKHQLKNSNTGTKWETMVKSTNVHHGHIRCSEELISHTPRQHNRP